MKYSRVTRKGFIGIPPLPVVMLVAPGLRVVLRSAAICKVVAFIYPPFPPVYGILDIDASGLACYEAR